MFGNVIRADATETLIGLVVLVLWVVGNIVSASKKRTQKPAPPPMGGKPQQPAATPPGLPPEMMGSPEDELRELLERLAGGVRRPAPPPIPPPLPPETVRHPQPQGLRERLRRHDRRPRFRPAQGASATMPAPPPPRPPQVAAARPVAEENHYATVEPVGGRRTPDLRGAMASAVRIADVALPRIRIGPAAPLGGSGGTMERGAGLTALAREMHGRRGLRHAFIVQTIVGPPRALQPYRQGEYHEAR